MKRFLPVLMATLLVFSIVALASARGAPNDNADAVDITATVDSPVVVAESAPTMTGFDVIQNLTEPRDLSIAQNSFDVVTTARRGLSPTVDWRSNQSVRSGRARSSPLITLKR